MNRQCDCQCAHSADVCVRVCVFVSVDQDKAEMNHLMTCRTSYIIELDG